MRTKKVPLRSCVVTREKLEKKDLLRVVKQNDGTVFVDDTLRANGRGAYLKKETDVILKAQKCKILDKILGIEIKDNIYDDLKNRIK
ncbi:MAG: YlxR family protein [Clostridia bacterium]